MPGPERARERGGSQHGQLRPTVRAGRAELTDRAGSVQDAADELVPEEGRAEGGEGGHGARGARPEQRDPEDRPLAKLVRADADHLAQDPVGSGLGSVVERDDIPQLSSDPAHVVGRVPVQPARRNQRPLRVHGYRVPERSRRTRDRTAVQRGAGGVEPVGCA